MLLAGETGLRSPPVLCANQDSAPSPFLSPRLRPLKSLWNRHPLAVGFLDPRSLRTEPPLEEAETRSFPGNRAERGIEAGVIRHQGDLHVRAFSRDHYSG